MSDDDQVKTTKKRSSKLPLVILGISLLVVYPLSIPFYYLIGGVLPLWLPEWVFDAYLSLSHIYDPLECLYFNVDWVKDFYDWYEQFFPWWQ